MLAASPAFPSGYSDQPSLSSHQSASRSPATPMTLDGLSCGARPVRASQSFHAACAIASTSANGIRGAPLQPDVFRARSTTSSAISSTDANPAPIAISSIATLETSSRQDHAISISSGSNPPDAGPSPMPAARRVPRGIFFARLPASSACGRTAPYTNSRFRETPAVAASSGLSETAQVHRRCS